MVSPLNPSRSASRKAAEAILRDEDETMAAKHVATLLLQVVDEQDRNACALRRVIDEAQLLFAEIARGEARKHRVTQRAPAKS